ncbi:hypothetical protein EDD29_6068 [Actinocorallia herbida]|uniref:Superfamily III holin-X n=1 Tax=Actinocorallia herbida TaxID=58109 RepID=A0A3N1D4I3_9ACTN|nr:hypothetical protein [Actinocorallia herbida]ROO88399.1 hypothetical protein EDD29_6068 [Actinocorallia herbida]
MNRTPDEPRPDEWFDIAKQWAELPVGHLRIAVRAVETRDVRAHEYRMEELRLGARRESEQRTHRLYMAGLITGFLIAVGMLTGAVIVGINDQPWLAAMLAGPSVLALATLFVLRRSDPAQVGSVGRAHGAALAASQQPPVL